MGINGLLPKLKSIIEKKHIKEYSNKKVGVDAYVWLHRGVLSCCQELVQNIPTDKYLTYCVNMVKMLLYHKIIPVIVFDGGYLPSKKEKEIERRESRQRNQDEGIMLLRNGNLKGAQDCFKKAVDVTPKMAKELMKKLDELKVEYVVSPYEADAQLAFLCRTNYVHAIITEDSDLIPYECPRTLYKMDKYGNGEEVILRNLGLNTDLSFVNFTHDMLIRMCVLSGCDYLDSLPGIGIVNAYKIVRDYKSIDSIFEQLEKVFDASSIPKNYKKNFIKAELTFRHQRVFDIKNQKLITLNELPKEISNNSENLTFLGPVLSPKVYLSICKGKMDPISFKLFDGKDEVVETVPQKVKSPFLNNSLMKIGISKKQKVNSTLIDKYLKSDEETLSSFDSQKSSYDLSDNSQNEKEKKLKNSKKKFKKIESSEEEKDDENEEENEDVSENESEEEEEVVTFVSKKRKNSVLIEKDDKIEIINLVSEKRNLFDMIYKKKKQ